MEVTRNLVIHQFCHLLGGRHQR